MAIRVLLDASTTLVKSALGAALGECPDIELVDQHGVGGSPSDVDVIVVQRPLFGDLPVAQCASRIGIVAINDDGQVGSLYRISRSGWRFAPHAGGGLADAIRAVAEVN